MGCCSSKPEVELPPAPVPRKLTHVKPLVEKTEHAWSVDVMRGERFKFMEPFCLYPQHGLEVPQFANNSSTADFVFECVGVPAFELSRTMSLTTHGTRADDRNARHHSSAPDLPNKKCCGTCVRLCDCACACR